MDWSEFTPAFFCARAPERVTSAKSMTQPLAWQALPI